MPSLFRERKPVGRPRGPDKVTISMKVTEDEREMIDAMVARTGSESVSDLIRKSISAYCSGVAEEAASPPEPEPVKAADRSPGESPRKTRKK